MSTYVLIEKYTVGAGGASSVTLGSGGTIKQTFTDLVLLHSSRNDSSTTVGVNLQINGNTTNIYSARALGGNGASAYSYIPNPSPDYAGTGGLMNMGSHTSNTFSNNQIYFANYTSSNYKVWSNDGIEENNATTAYIGMDANLASTTSAITSIKIWMYGGSNIAQYSTFYLYGILKA